MYFSVMRYWIKFLVQAESMTTQQLADFCQVHSTRVGDWRKEIKVADGPIFLEAMTRTEVKYPEFVPLTAAQRQMRAILALFEEVRAQWFDDAGAGPAFDERWLAVLAFLHDKGLTSVENVNVDRFTRSYGESYFAIIRKFAFARDLSDRQIGDALSKWMGPFACVQHSHPGILDRDVISQAVGRPV